MPLVLSGGWFGIIGFFEKLGISYKELEMPEEIPN